MEIVSFVSVHRNFFLAPILKTGLSANFWGEETSEESSGDRNAMSLCACVKDVKRGVRSERFRRNFILGYRLWLYEYYCCKMGQRVGWLEERAIQSRGKQRFHIDWFELTCTKRNEGKERRWDREDREGGDFDREVETRRISRQELQCNVCASSPIFPPCLSACPSLVYLLCIALPINLHEST